MPMPVPCHARGVLIPAAAAAKRQAEQRPVVVPLCQDRVWGSSRHRSTDSQLPAGHLAAAAAGQRGAWHLCGIQVSSCKLLACAVAACLAHTQLYHGNPASCLCGLLDCKGR
jgi:hypothetical protein